MTEYYLPLLQLCDSNFPTGAFSHSYGLETYIQEDKVHDRESFVEWLTAFVHEQLIYTDGLACRIAYQALAQQDFETLWTLDHKLNVQNLPSETREGTQRIGQRMGKLMQSLYDIPILTDYMDRIQKKQSFGHPSIVFTIVGHHLKATSFATTLYFLYSTCSSLIQNAVRAIPLGQTDGQKTIQQFHDELVKATESIQQLEEEDFGVVSPGLELAQMKHEHVNIRIFMS
ncbi:urease accessory protein UreF [Sporosarcina sp. P13]|uniref:urease accessory protein UreF n=1 Tax=Sporosarcina sp. P13 TaxID=2048263 RepID=UPI000C172895|nr:urease accessory protein UreF [Sporosarcina sp. P13]PIC62659.1 urease accessory protein UreF [Sporosarcina sp. P13]